MHVSVSLGCFNFQVLLLYFVIAAASGCSPFVPNNQSDYKGWFGIPFESKRNKILPCACGSISNNAIGAFRYPWHVLIAHTMAPTSGSIQPQPGRKSCSGTLINDRVVLTSASCVLKASVAKVLDHPVDSVLYPKDFVTSHKELRVWITYDMTATPKAPKLRIKMDFDIALLTLKEHLEFGTTTTKSVPVCLPSKFLDSELEGIGIFSSKWFVTNLMELFEKQTVDSVSEEAVGPSPNFIYNRMRCRVNTGTTWISDRFLCTIAPGFSDTRHADLGGALLAESEGRFTQYAINSWKSYITLLSYKQPVSLATNVAGFMSRIENCSAKMDAKWCSDDWNGIPDPRGDFVATLVNQKLELSKPWIGITSSFRNIREGCHCGRVNSKQQGRIQGGSEATPYEYGWQVLLVMKSARGTSLCGVALINDRVVLTAAHCLVSFSDEDPPTKTTIKVENIQVYISRHYGAKKRDDKSRIVKVKAIVPHPNFVVDPTLVNVVALIELSEPLDFKGLQGIVSPLCVPETDEAIQIDDRQDAKIIGWGRVNALKPGTAASTLQELSVKVISNEECKERLEKFGFQYPEFLNPFVTEFSKKVRWKH